MSWGGGREGGEDKKKKREKHAVAVSVQLAERGSTASFPGKECLQVASVGRSVVHQKAQPDFSPIRAGTQSAVSNRGSVV